MRFFKKNPSINGPVWVQGIEIDGEKVVTGDEFAPFADPSTFPGKEPKLVHVEFGSMNEEQVDDIKKQANDKAKKPPRHLPMTSSISFDLTGERTMKEETSKPRKKEPEPSHTEKKIEKKVNEIKNDLSSILEKRLTSLYDPKSIVEDLPGVTEKNATKILSKFKTLGDLASASNADLRRAGVSVSFFKRLRNAVDEIVRKVESSVIHD